MKEINFGELLERYREKFDNGFKTDSLDSLKEWIVYYGKREETGKTVVYVLFEPPEG